MGIHPMTGKVQTVLGAIDAGELGVTLHHEHFLVSTAIRFREPDETSLKALALQPVSLENLGWIRYHPQSNLDNLQFLDEELAIEEALRFKRAGGVSVVDMTNIGIGRDPLALARISRATGLNVVMGAGYYTEATVPQEVRTGLTEDKMVDRIVRDITDGVGTTGIRAGIIGEIGTEWPMSDFERMSLRASARAQKETGAPINVHTGTSPSSPFEIVSVLEAAGADLSRVGISHVDSRIFDHRIAVELARTGVYLGYDSFSLEGWYERRTVLSEDNPLKCDVPNDAGRLNEILALIADGFLDQVLISHDLCMKHRLWKWGGPGYSHILDNVVPLMREKGFTEEQIQGILVENPKRLMQFV